MAEKKDETTRSLRDRIKDSLNAIFSTAKTAEDMSDSDTRAAIDVALRDTVPAYYGIQSVYPSEGLVVYATTKGETWHLFQQKYSVADDGSVSLEDAAVEVEAVMRYEEITAAEGTHTGCGCKAKPSALSAHIDTGESIPMATLHKNATRITALIANPKTAWTEHDRAHLETQDDARIAALEAAMAEPVAEPTKEIALSDLPQAWQDAINREALTAAAAKTAKVAALEGPTAGVYSRAELEAMSMDGLEKVEKILGVVSAAPAALAAAAPVSFAGRAAAAPVAPAGGEFTAPAPPDMNARLVAAAAK